MFPTTFQGAMFKVEYTLMFYVKHDARNNPGEGNCVVQPIKIIQKPFKFPSEKITLPRDWQPQIQPEVHVVFPVKEV